MRGKEKIMGTEMTREQSRETEENQVWILNIDTESPGYLATLRLMRLSPHLEELSGSQTSKFLSSDAGETDWFNLLTRSRKLLSEKLKTLDYHTILFTKRIKFLSSDKEWTFTQRPVTGECCVSVSSRRKVTHAALPQDTVWWRRSARLFHLQLSLILK